jgi:hypothetical protein
VVLRSCGVALPKHFEVRHVVALVVLGALAVALIGVIVREIYYAANADKRPRKRKRKR